MPQLEPPKIQEILIEGQSIDFLKESQRQCYVHTYMYRCRVDSLGLDFGMQSYVHTYMYRCRIDSLGLDVGTYSVTYIRTGTGAEFTV